MLGLLSGGLVQAHPGDEASIAYLSQKLQQQPAAEFYLLRASLYLRHGELQSAESDIDAAEKLEGPAAVAVTRSQLLQLRGRKDAAVGQLNLFLDAFPNQPNALQQRARLLAETGRAADAIRDYRQLLRSSRPVGPGLYLEAAQLIAAAEGPQPALDVLDQGMDQLGMTVALQRRAIDLCLDARLHAAAIERQRRLRAVMGSSPLWRIEMAELYARVGEPKSAERELQSLEGLAASITSSPGMQAILERVRQLQAQIRQTQADASVSG